MYAKLWYSVDGPFVENLSSYLFCSKEIFSCSSILIIVILITLPCISQWIFGGCCLVESLIWFGVSQGKLNGYGLIILCIYGYGYRLPECRSARVPECRCRCRSAGPVVPGATLWEQPSINYKSSTINICSNNNNKFSINWSLLFCCFCPFRYF